MSKQSYRGYREAARAHADGWAIAAGDGQVVSLRVPLHAEVHEVEGGAFVEAVVWVPEGALPVAEPAVEPEDPLELQTFSAGCVLLGPLATRAGKVTEDVLL